MLDSLFRGEKYTTEQLNARLKFFIGVVLGLTLFGIVFVVLYSLIFVTQPMNGMSPVDNKFFELIIPIATFLTGTLSGIMLAGDDKELRAKAIDAATKSVPPSTAGLSGFPTSANVVPSSGSFNRTAAPSAVSPSFGSPVAAPGFGAAPVTTGRLGKPGPMLEPDEEL